MKRFTVAVETSDAPSVDDLLSSYSFDLPKEQIAKTPLPVRSDAKLMVVNDEGVEHSVFNTLPSRLKRGDVLVVNNTRVVPARLVGKREGSGGRVEVVLCRREGEHVVALVGMNKRIRAGQVFRFGEEAPMLMEVVRAQSDEPGAFLLKCDQDAYAFAAKHGKIPLPPYLERDESADDRERYQTIFAHSAGASAAPTAGLHFDEGIMNALRERGVEVVHVTLHTGPGTFLPVREDDVRKHAMHVEPWWVSPEAAQSLNSALDEGRRIIAVGTTSLRVLESAPDTEGRFVPGSSGTTRIFIRPGYRFRCASGLVTNFHLSQSTLLMLVSAIAGRERTLSFYEEAKALSYRFFSYGDASLYWISKKVRQ